MTEFINNNPASGLKAGFGCAPVIFEQSYFEITGEDGNITYLDGFNGRVHIFEGAEGQIKDDLMTRVMLIEDGERAAIVALEIAQAPADQIAYTKDIVSEICDCKPENIWVHVTHQFGFMHRMGNAEKAEIYDEKMKESVARAAENAVKDLQYAAYGIGTGKCHVSSNKNIINPEAPGEGPYFGPGSALETDPCMTVIRFCSRSGGKDIGFFLSYGTKPSALCTTGKDAGNREVNTEVTGHACKMVEEHFKAPCLFCMPAAGDQYPRETAQYYGFDTDGIWKKIDIGFERGIEIVDRLGKEMGEDAIAIAEKTVCDKTSSEVALYETAFSYRNKAGDAMISIDRKSVV